MNDLTLVSRLTSQMLSRFLDRALVAQRPALVAALRPEPDDYARVFRGEAAARAREGYEPLWQSSIPVITPRPEQTNLMMFLALGQDFTEGHPRTRRFPGGYGKIAEHLAPDMVWACWKFVAPGQSVGMAYDGLVSLGERWAWFPKPWKFVLPRASTMGHWSD